MKSLTIFHHDISRADVGFDVCRLQPMKAHTEEDGASLFSLMLRHGILLIDSKNSASPMDLCEYCNLL